jgi:hypothetical protein
MRIKIEPKAFFMSAVFLAFSKERPAPEDEAIKAYLRVSKNAPSRAFLVLVIWAS